MLSQIKQYRDALGEIERLDNLENEYKQRCRDISYEIDRRYREKKYKLEERERKEKAVIEKENEEFKLRCKTERMPYYEVIDNIKVIYKLMDVHVSKKVAVKKEIESIIESRDESPFIIERDDYKAVWVSTYSNRKPKNKFSLVIKFKSIFQWAFPELNINDRELKDLPTEKELKVWYEKNKDNLRWRWGGDWFFLNDILEKHASLEKRYEEVIELYKDKRWKVAYWNYKKDYYLHHYSRGDETDEYKFVLDMLLLLRTPRKKLPLLIGSLQSEPGSVELERRLRNGS